jgi:hypothetical protein
MSDSSGGGASQKSGPKSSSSGQAATVTKLSVSKVATASKPVTMSARVSLAHRTAGAPPATGTMVFTVDGASSRPVPLTGGKVLVKVKLDPGEHTASAKYSGDDEHAPSDSGPVSVMVG